MNNTRPRIIGAAQYSKIYNNNNNNNNNNCLYIYCYTKNLTKYQLTSRVGFRAPQ